MTYQTGSVSAPSSGVGREVFVLTDEQILEIETEALNPASVGQPFLAVQAEAAKSPQSLAQEAALQETAQPAAHKGAQPGMAVPQEPPDWLAERMRDPWVGDEARELWEGAQRAQRESAAYREAFATPEEARELKQIYPGGASEAKGAAERARQLEDIDAAFFGAVGKAPEELRAGRTQLVEKLYALDPAAFREMVELAKKILGGERSNGGMGGNTAGEEERTANAETQRTQSSEEKREVPGDRRPAASGEVSHEVARAYAEFEKAANAELEKSVGGAIARSMEQALPNLRRMSAAAGEQGATGLPGRLTNAVREEIDAALRSDAQLGEQVSRILAGKRFDDAARTQVVRLIDARAQQLVPGAVRRVVGAWTEATVSGRRTDAKNGPRVGESAKAVGAANARGRRVDYGKLSDEEILEL